MRQVNFSASVQDRDRLLELIDEHDSNAVRVWISGVEVYIDANVPNRELGALMPPSMTAQARRR